MGSSNLPPAAHNELIFSHTTMSPSFYLNLVNPLFRRPRVYPFTIFGVSYFRLVNQDVMLHILSEIFNDMAFGHRELIQPPPTKIFKCSLRLQQTYITEGQESIFDTRLCVVLVL